ncbi:MAG: hypothetical protein ACPGVT_00820 [Maricaulaceae bacterium]
MINLTVIDIKDGVSTIIAQPKLQTSLDKQARFQMGVEGIDMIDFTFHPKTKQ